MLLSVPEYGATAAEANEAGAEATEAGAEAAQTANAAQTADAPVRAVLQAPPYGLGLGFGVGCWLGVGKVRVGTTAAGTAHRVG